MLKQVQCGDFEELAVLYAAGEMEEPERCAVEAHARACTECSAILQREMQLAEFLSAGRQTPGEADLLLAECRRELGRALEKEKAPPAGWRWVLPWNWGWALRTSANFHPAWSVAGLAAAALIAGIAGWQGIGRAPVKAGSPVMTIASAAALSDQELARMGIESLHWEPRAGEPASVELRLKGERPVVLRGSASDSDIRRVLAYVVRNGPRFDPGVRLDSLELLRSQAADPQVNVAIREAAQRDPNPAVRLRALESLRDLGGDPEVRRTMLNALAQDENSGVRIEAVDGLLSAMGKTGAAGWPDENVLEILQDRMRNDPNDYVRMRSATAFAQLASARGRLATDGR